MNEMDKIIYRNESYTLALSGEQPVFATGGGTYLLSCHPYDPCTYIRSEGDGLISVIRSAFDPSYVFEAFSKGESVTSVTGKAYSPREFCELLDHAVRYFSETVIDEVERRAFPEPPADDDRKIADESMPKHLARSHDDPDSEMYEQNDDPFYRLIARYPDLVTEYRLIKSKKPYAGESSHREALAAAMRSLSLSDGEDEPLWEYDISRAAASAISSDELFAELDKQDTIADGGDIPYRRAFLFPPYGQVYREDDFAIVNDSLFPNGTSDLIIYRWTTDWSDYFDDGHEWWGVLCVTAYDPTLHRYVVILASATD